MKKEQYISIGLLTVVFLLSGCSQPTQPPTKKNVKVQFRRDALGGAHTLPISPNTDSINGAQVSLSGKLLTVNDEWIVLEHNKRNHWIPRDAVLLIRMEN